MSGFIHSLFRVPFRIILIQNVLALTLTVDWKNGQGAAAAVGGSWLVVRPAGL